MLTQCLPILQLGLPDRFVDQGTRAQLLTECRLDAANIEQRIAARLAQLQAAHTVERGNPKPLHTEDRLQSDLYQTEPLSTVHENLATPEAKAKKVKQAVGDTL